MNEKTTKADYEQSLKKMIVLEQQLRSAEKKVNKIQKRIKSENEAK